MALLNRRIPYARRLFIWLLVYSLMLVGCFVIYQYNRETDFKAAELNGRLQLVNSYISNELDRGYAIADIELDDLKPFDDIRVSIIDKGGNVVYDNSLDRLPGTNHLDRDEIVEAKKNGSGYALRRASETTGETYFYSASLMSDGTIIRTAVPYSASLTTELTADYTFVWIMSGITLIFCVLGFFATRRMGQNVSRLNEFAAAAERGDRITDTETFPHNELGDISSNIVRLYARLQAAVAERDREHASAMHQQREKERIKKQLTNNINHELKTPVAAIRVCVETLLAHDNMDPVKRREFLERLLANTDRLKHLLDDVALITRMDDGGNVVAMGPVDLCAVIAEVVDQDRPIASKNGMTIDNSVGDAPLMVNGNEGLLESVFNNLIDNAAAHSGGTRVAIAIRSLHPDRVVITVADNGHGVGAEHLSHLFERFYRVDKGRSRALGGTGLGLSIVRNAVALHGGTISVANGAEGGLTFTITLPLMQKV